jgi:hypothetical protein
MLNFIRIYFRDRIYENLMETEHRISFDQDYKVVHVIDEHLIGIAFGQVVQNLRIISVRTRWRLVIGSTLQRFCTGGV